MRLTWFRIVGLIFATVSGVVVFANSSFDFVANLKSIFSNGSNLSRQQTSESTTSLEYCSDPSLDGCTERSNVFLSYIRRNADRVVNVRIQMHVDMEEFSKRCKDQNLGLVFGDGPINYFFGVSENRNSCRISHYLIVKHDNVKLISEEIGETYQVFGRFLMISKVEEGVPSFELIKPNS